MTVLTGSRVRSDSIRQFHGDPVARARERAEAQKKAGSTLYKFTELAGEGHVVHKPVSQSGEALIWPFEQKRGARE